VNVVDRIPATRHPLFGSERLGLSKAFKGQIAVAVLLLKPDVIEYPQDIEM
jgi:hypothetical protein